VKTPTLVIDRDIAAFDTFAEMFGENQPVFSANSVQDFLDANADATEIVVEVRSDGGSTSEARIIYDMLKNCGKKVTTKGYKVNSSAVIIFLAGSERLVAENADFLIHPVWIDAMGLPWMLTGEDLQLFANEVKAEESKLINIYLGVIGEDKREEVTQLMADSTNLSQDKAISLGFATGKLEEQGLKSENKRAITYNSKMSRLVLQNKVKNQPTQQEMSILKDTLNSINETLKSFKNKETENNETETQNASSELAEGGSVYFDGELAEGSAVFTDEAMETPAPDGDHALADGRVMSVADGMVTALAAASSEDEDNNTENNAADLAALNARIDALETANTAILEGQNAIADTLKNFSPALDAMKNLVPGEKENKNTTKERRVQETNSNRVCFIEQQRENGV
jgi:ATP-dependent protease ClpP protease subunit